MINLLPAASFLYKHGTGTHSGIDHPDIDEDICSMFGLYSIDRHETYQDDLFWLPNNRYEFRAFWGNGIWYLAIEKKSGDAVIPEWDLQRCA